MLQKELGQMVAEEVEYILKYTGSDAGEKQVPGSKLRGQLRRIKEFVNQVESAQDNIRAYRARYHSDMVRITISRASDYGQQKEDEF